MADALSVQQYREIFVEHSALIAAEVFDKLAHNAHATHRPLDQLLIEQAFITQQQYLELLGSYFSVPTTELRITDIDLEALHAIPEDFAAEHLVVSFGLVEGQHAVAMQDPLDTELIAELERLLSSSVKPFVSNEVSLRRALVLYDGDLKSRIDRATEEALSTGNDENHLSAETVAPLVMNIIETAVFMESSDVHIEPYETEVIVRFRIDGQLRTIATMPTVLSDSMAARIKVLANMKIDQKRLPQDGRFTIDAKGQEVNVRVSTLPSMFGEKVVMRVLPKESQLFNMLNLGLLGTDLELIREYLKKPHGMILVTGPTNSGKSTSLYAFLQEIGLDRIDLVNISTIEDPIEYTMPRITQVQTDNDINLTFAAGLRALLRQDPDIIMVGEIRDKETADFAIRASLVGRLVFSTLHTNDAPGTIPRLLDMGIEPYLVSSTLSLIVAQRLARKLCEHCRESFHPDDETWKRLYEDYGMERAMHILQQIGTVNDPDPVNLRFFRAVGCERCGHSGYKGRVGLYEILQITDPVRAAIYEQRDSSTIRDIALSEGMKTMFEDGIAKIVLGLIDLDELLRTAYA